MYLKINTTVSIIPVYRISKTILIGFVKHYVDIFQEWTASERFPIEGKFISNDNVYLPRDSRKNRQTIAG